MGGVRALLEPLPQGTTFRDQRAIRASVRAGDFQSPSTLEAAHSGHRRGAALGLMGREAGNWGGGHTTWEASGTDRTECCSATCCVMWASWEAPGPAPPLNTGTQPRRQPSGTLPHGRQRTRVTRPNPGPRPACLATAIPAPPCSSRTVSARDDAAQGRLQLRRCRHTTAQWGGGTSSGHKFLQGRWGLEGHDLLGL